MPKSRRPSSSARLMPPTITSIGTPRAVCVCGSKKISACTTLSEFTRRRYAVVIAWKSDSSRRTSHPA
jgi:hypothetical protein